MPLTTDLTRASFPLQLAVIIVTAFVTAFSGMWAATYGLRSDVRDILTRMSMQRELDAAQIHLQEERAAALRDSIEAMKRRQELQQYEIQGLKELILTGKPRRLP